MSLQVGAAEVRITPPVGMDLSGYAHREGPSTAIHDDLWCRALVLDDGTVRLAVIALDLLGLDFALDAAIRQEVARGIRLRGTDALLLNCSHTHAGPAVTELWALGEPNRAYVASLPGLVAEAARAAEEQLAPVTGAFGSAPARVGINRRERTADGSIIIGRNPQGLRDESVRVLLFRDRGGEPAAVLFSHSCHGTTLGGENREITAEWMGAACQELRKRMDGRAVPMFLQGCCGQINPEREERSFAQVAQLGEQMAEAVMTAIHAAQPLRMEGLGARLARAELPLQDPPEAGSARARLSQAEAALAQARGSGVHSYLVRTQEELVAYHRQVLAMAERGERDLKLPFVVQGMRVGELALVGLSGEVFLEFALQIAAASPFPHTVVLGYSNGCTGYVPTAEAIAEGGYEPDSSFHYYGTLPLAPEAGEVMVAAAVRLLGELRHQ